MTTEQFFAMNTDKPAAKVCQVVANWTPQVQFVPDTVHQGQPMPGVVGKLYFFGEQVGLPLAGDGTVHLELSAILPERPQDGWICLEKLDIDKASMKKLLQEDIVGTGYTMLLPWWSYRPDVTQIQMNLSYTPENGNPLFTVSKVSLSPSETPLALIDSRQEFGDRRRYTPPVAQAPSPLMPQPPSGPMQQTGYSMPMQQQAGYAMPAPSGPVQQTGYAMPAPQQQPSGQRTWSPKQRRSSWC